MNRSTLSHYGWIIVVFIILTILFAFATPVGRGIMEKYFEGAAILTDMAEDVNPNGALLSPHNISAAHGYGDIISFSKTIADKGDVIEVTSNANPLMEITQLKLLYNSREIIVDGSSFKMLNANVTVTPIWNTYQYTKVFFTNYNDALAVATAVGDKTFNDRLQVKIDDVVYYVVHDASPNLGYLKETGSYLYKGLTSVSKVVLGQNLKKVSDYAFADCTKLTDVIFNAKTTNIGNYAFFNCTSFSNEIKFYAGLKSIGDSAFENTKITGVHFNDGLKKIGDKAFYNCSDLLYANCNTMPDGIEFGPTAFDPDFFAGEGPGDNVIPGEEGDLPPDNTSDDTSDLPEEPSDEPSDDISEVNPDDLFDIYE